jgi:hypothetical protein
VIPILLRGMLPRVVLVALAGLMFFMLEPGFHQHAGEVVPEEFRLDLGALGISASLANLSALAMLLLFGGVISADRRQGYYRMYFSHPTRPLAYYGLRWVLALLLAVAASVVFLVLGQLAAWGRFEGGWSGIYLALLAAIAYGGLIAFLATVLDRGDIWVALILFFFTYFWFYAVTLGIEPLPSVAGEFVSLVLPPQIALDDVRDGLLRGEIAWGASAFVTGYGVFWLLIASLLLKLRDWP